MTTSMKKVEVYTSWDKCPRVVEVLAESRLYWYNEKVMFRGEVEVCRIVFYAPVHGLSGIYEKLRGILDFRTREDMVVVEDVEAGSGLPYRLANYRFAPVAGSLASRPRFVLIEEAKERSRLSRGQAILVVLASLVALAGLLSNNPYVIIGAMLISPILGPIYAFAITLALRESRVATESLTTLGLLLGLAVAASAIASLIVAAAGSGLEPTPEILARAQIDPATVLVPFLLGVATSLAVTAYVYEALVGVAIAAAIIPPAAVVGWSLVADHSLLAGSVATLALNVAGLLLGGVASAVYVVRRAPQSV